MKGVRGTESGFRIESLEDRLLLAAWYPHGPEFRVNSHARGDQSHQAAAMDDEGNFVVAWKSMGQDGSGEGVYAQRYNAAGVHQGPEFRVNTTTVNDQDYPAVAMDGDGEFVIAWQSFGQDGNGEGVYAQRYAADGQPQGPEFRVNTRTGASQMRPAVAMGDDGSFLVAWQSWGHDNSEWGIYAQAFATGGVPLGAEFRVNTIRAQSQEYAAVATGPDGMFVIAWMSQQQDGGGYGIFAERFNAATGQRFGEFRVNETTALDQKYPAIAADAAGNFVVSWHGQEAGSLPGQVIDGIYYMRRYGPQGQPLTGETRLNPVDGQQLGAPSLALADDGALLVAWADIGVDGESHGVRAMRYHADLTPDGQPWVVNTMTDDSQSTPALAIDADGDAVIAWVSQGQDGYEGGVYAQRYRTGLTGSVSGMFFDDRNGDLARNWDEPGLQGWLVYLDLDDDGAVDLADPRAATGPDGTYSIGRVPAGAYTLRAVPQVGWTFSRATRSVSVLAAQSVTGADLAASAKRPPLELVPAGEPFSAAFSGDAPNVASDADGNFIVVYQAPDASSSGIFARRYEANGAPLGPAFAVNSHTASRQHTPAVAADADGDFIIAWTSDGQDGSESGVYARRFGADGTPRGGEFRVNTHTANLQRYPAVAADARGGFVVAWQSFAQDGSNEGIYAQRYDADGLPRGGEFAVNALTSGAQTYPVVSMSEGGAFVVAWMSDGNIFARLYAADGLQRGDEFIVNTDAGFGERYPDVAMDDDGNFVVAWESAGGQDGSGSGIYAQRFDAAGTHQGTSFLVNTTTDLDQLLPAVAMDADGDFLITWMRLTAASVIEGRHYSAAGLPQGPEIRVSTAAAAGMQIAPAIAADAEGDFVILWDGHDVGQNGVLVRRYDSSAPAAVRLEADASGQRLFIAFSEAVDPENVAFSMTLMRHGEGAVDSDLALEGYDATTRVARFRLLTPLPTGRYAATIAPGAMIDQAGHLSDRQFTFGFVVSTADADGDGKVTAADYFAIDRGRALRLSGFANGDFDASGGTPDADDYMVLDRAFLAPRVADGDALADVSPAPAAPYTFDAYPIAPSDPNDELAGFDNWSPADLLA